MFTFPLDADELFTERAIQMKSWGIPAHTVDVVRKAVTDSWSDGPGGWVYEWVKQAKLAEKAGRWLEAANCYGAAKFPVACTASREQALQNQTHAYLRAAAQFPCYFERIEVPVLYGGSLLPVPVHLFERGRGKHRKPRHLVCLSGGVDTCKMELHRLAVALAVLGGFRVVVMDMPGTGESKVLLQPDADVIYRSVIAQLKDKDAKVAMIGISFGGHWAAKLAFSGVVDAAVDIGGPVGFTAGRAAFFTTLPNGMTGIVANALGMDHLPTTHQVTSLMSAFSLREQGVLDQNLQAPLLVINGSNDPYIPIEDTLGFVGLPNASVWLVRNGHHCAAAQFARLVPSMLVWLRIKMYGNTGFNTALGAISGLIRPTLAKTHPFSSVIRAA